MLSEQTPDAHPSDLLGRRYSLVTLGCFRNEVESDLLRSALRELGMEETGDIRACEVALVMTCGFIREACDEGIDTILEIADISAAGPPPPIVVLGCMSQRYGADLMREMPEISGVLGCDWGPDLAVTLTSVLSGRKAAAPGRAPSISGVRRSVDSSAGPLFIRVSDGCDRACRFCAIPSIRGPHVSRQPDDILEETERLCAGRQREVVLLAQDLTSYGSDLGGGIDLPWLTGRVARVEGAHWVRLLYLQPEAVTERLIEAVASEPRVLRYFDIPFQHASSSVLAAMGRPGSGAGYLGLLEKVRAAMPDAAIRSTVMTGYPGETESDFEELAAFVESARFDWLGAFVFSPEEGTPAAQMEPAVPADTALSRYNRIVEIQDACEESRVLGMVGRELEVVIDGPSEVAPFDLVGRSYREAPVVDGCIYIVGRQGRATRETGAFLTARIIGQEGLDLVAEI